MHAGQVAAFRVLRAHRFKVLRCGRRFGKTDFAKIWIADGLARGMECAWFAPQHNTWSEVYPAMHDMLRPLVEQASRNPPGYKADERRTPGFLDLGERYRWPWPSLRSRRH